MSVWRHYSSFTGRPRWQAGGPRVPGASCHASLFWRPIFFSFPRGGRLLTLAERQDFKKGIDVDDARRKRDEHGLRIRKEKREEKLEQKRKTGTVKPQADVGRGANDLTLQTRLQKIPQWLDMIRTTDPQKQLEATTHFRKLLSIERNPPIQEVIACGVVPRLVEFLTFGDHAKVTLLRLCRTQSDVWSQVRTEI